MKQWYAFSMVLLLSTANLHSSDLVSGRVARIAIRPGEITPLHLHPEFESTIHMPEEITSVVLGSPGNFKAEHSEAEPEYVYVKPITKAAAQSNLLIATKSGAHVTLQLISDGNDASSADPVDFLIEYRSSPSFLVGASTPIAHPSPDAKSHVREPRSKTNEPPQLSFADEELALQTHINAPNWQTWQGQQIKTAIGDIRQWNNQMVVSYSLWNPSDHPVEITPPQVQISGAKAKKGKNKHKLTSQQLEVRDCRLSSTRLESGARADGVVIFDRPNFKESNEKLYLQFAQADQVDLPILIQLPFTPPVTTKR